MKLDTGSIDGWSRDMGPDLYGIRYQREVR